MRIKQKIQKIVVWLLVLSLTVTLVPINANAAEAAQEITEQTQAKPEEVTETGDEVVTVIVELEKEPAKNSGISSLFSARDNQREQVKKQIKKIVNPESNSFSNLFGLFGTDDSDSNFNVVYDYYTVMNGFAIEVEYRYLSEIQQLDGVKNAFVENTYSIPETQTDGSSYENSDVLELIGAKDNNYTGEGMVIAFIDSGLDTDHEAFVETGVTDTLTKDEVDSLTGELKAGNGSLGSDDVRVNTKIPFTYDYADGDTDVNPDGESDHGTHVAGIAAANGGTTVRGVAPDAQIVSLKVFADNSGSASDSDIIASLEDAVELKADVINMSLGSDAGFTTTDNSTYQDIYDSVKDAGILLSVASGNSYNSTYGNAANNSLARVTEPDNSIIAAPATYNASFAVASSTGAAQSSYLMAGKNKIRYQNSTKEGDVFTGFTGAQEYVVCGNGSSSAMEAALNKEGLESLQGKIALVERGGTEEGVNLTFETKANIAAAYGAIGIIVYDNVANNPLTDMGGITQAFPAAFISKEDGEILVNLEEKKVTFDAGYVMGAPTEMSSFSSWGVTPDLKLKPEITAPGSGIYSAAPDNKYETMSGTSMAAPQISGMSAAIKEYLYTDSKFSGYSSKDKDNLISALLMNTAAPVKIGNTWYSPRKQGAGLANVTNAVNAKAYITVEGADAAKPKAELGDGTQTRSFRFTVHNLTSDTLNYTIDTAALSEVIANGYFQQTSLNYTGNGIDVSYEGLTDGKVTLEANGSTDIKVTIAFGDAFKEAAAEAVNGTFVDGFVMLSADDNSGSDLSLPFLAFYGDWGMAPIFDGTEIDGDYSMGQTKVYSTSTDKELGQNLFDASLGIMPDKYVVSTKGLYGFVLGLRTQTYLLRNADKLTYAVTQQSTGSTVLEKKYYQVKKSYYYTTAGMVSYVEGLISDVPKFKGFDDNGNELPEGWYTYSVTAAIPGTEGRTQNWSFDFYFDQSKPQIHSSEVIEIDGKKVLRLELSDKHYISGVELKADRTKVDEYDSTLIEQKTYKDPDNAEAKKADKNIDSTYTMDIDYDTLVEKLEAQGAPADHIVLNVYDYALNYVSEKIYLRDIYPESIHLNTDNISLTRGEEADLAATLLPDNTNKKAIGFVSSNPEIAAVDADGKITAKAPGTATITVKTEAENVTAACVVTVSEIGADTGIVLNRKSLNLSIGTPAALRATLRDGITGEIEWISSDSEVVSVDNGVLTPKKIGTATISARISYGNQIYEASCEVKSQVKATDQFAIDENGVLTQFYGAAVDIRIPEGVTEIAEKAFYNYDIQSVVIPASVKKIGASAFQDCYKLNSISFSQGSTLESIGDYAFSNTILTSISLPDSLTSLGAGVFYDGQRAMALTSVTIPEKVTVIPDDLFGGNMYLEKVVLPDGITSIGAGAFASDIVLKEINIPSALESIGDKAFLGSGLTSFIAPENLKSIGNDGFADAPLTTVVLNQKIETIGDQAFRATKVSDFVFPDSVTTVGSNVLSYADNLKTVKIGKGITQLITPFVMSEALLNIEVSAENPVYKSVDGVLLSKDNERITAYPAAKKDSSYTVPEGVITIEDSAFMKAVYLQELDFSSNAALKNIGISAFEYASLKELSLPDSVETLGIRAFSFCEKMSALDLNKVKQIGSYAFQYTAIVNPDFGDSLVSIGERSFAYCPALETVVLPDSLITIGNSAFLNSPEIKSIHLGAGLDTLDDIPFTGASKLETITVSEDNTSFKSVDNVLMSADGKTLLLYLPTKQNEVYTVAGTTETIKRFAFRNAVKLKKAVLPEGLKNIEVSAFNGCTSLEDINIPDSTEKIGMFAFSNTNLKSIYIGTKINQLEDSALSLMSNLKHIVISGENQISFSSTLGLDSLSTIYLGDGVKSIGAFSLQYESLKTVVLGKDIEEIDSWAFLEGTDITFYTIAGTKADSIVKEFTYGTVKNYKPLTINSLKADQKQVTEETRLIATVNGGIGSTRYRFTKLNQDGTETELQSYSASNSLTVQVPEEGAVIRVYVRDGSYYIVQKDIELYRGMEVEGSFVAKAVFEDSDGQTSELQKYFDGVVKIDNGKEASRVGIRLYDAVTKVKYQGSLLEKDEQGVYWIPVSDLSNIPLEITTDTEVSAILKIDMTTLKSPAETAGLNTLIEDIGAFVAEKKALQDAKQVYTTDSFTNLIEKLEAAKTALGNWMITQEEVEDISNGLEAAKSGLKIAIIPGRMYTATDTMNKEDGYTSMMAPILSKTASLERTEKGTWLVTFDIIAGEIMGYALSGENVNSITYKYNGLAKDAKILEYNQETGLKRFQIEMKDLSAPVEMDISYYMWSPEYPTSSTAYFVIREESLTPVGLDEEVTVDKTGLAAKIAEAKAIDETKYTSESYAKLKEAISSAEAVSADENATREQVDIQTAALQKAIDELVSVIDYSQDGTYEVSLRMWNASADKASSMDNAIEKTGYVVVKDGQAKLYMTLLPLGNFYAGTLSYVASNGDKIPVQVITEYPVVDDYNNPDTGKDEVMKGKLYPKLISLPIVLGEEYTLMEIYVPAMGEAGTQPVRIKMDYKSIVKAETIDTTILSEAVENAEQFVEKEYTAGSYAVLISSLEAAKAILENTAAYSFADVVDAKLAIDQAVSALIKAENPPAAADKKELTAAISKAKELVESEYTKDSWSVFKAALEKAEAISADTNANQEAVNAAKAELLSAIEGLVEEPGNTEQPANTEEPADTEQPANTEEPVNTDKPVNTEQPVNSENFQNTENTDGDAKTDITQNDSDSNTTAKGGEVKTGDQNASIFYIIAMGSSLAMIGTVLFRGKKKRTIN